jgi:hypothetical protein
MKRIFCLLLFILVSTSGIAQKLNDDKIEELVKTWNTATIDAAKDEFKRIGRLIKHNERDTDIRENQLILPEFNASDKNSLRYKFLAKLKGFKTNSDFYVVETVKSGEVVTTQNFVIYHTKNRTKIYKFEYWQGWKLEYEFKIKGKITFNPYGLDTLRGSGGVNANNVIITHFIDYKITESFFFLPGTMTGFLVLFNF